MTRATIHYIASFLILSLYGGQVCPFIEGLSVWTWTTYMGIIFIAMYLARMALRPWLVRNASPERRVTRGFLLDLCIYLVAALAITAFNTIFHSFPPGSGMKAMTGFMTLGFFAAVDLALVAEWTLAMEFAREGRALKVAGEPIFPMVNRFAMVAMVTVSMVVMVLFLLVNKDLEWLSTLPTSDSHPSFVVLGEMALVGMVFLFHLVNIIYSYKRNLRLFFGLQNGALASVSEGELYAMVPISSRDEFGVMGEYTNQMITALRERTEEVHRTRDVTILSLATLAETRDNETGGHILRTQGYVRALAMALREHQDRRDELTVEIIDLLYKSAPLHDIGKVGIPDAILLKPGKLTVEEFGIMKKHPVLGRDAITRAEETLDAGDGSFLRYARQIAYGHHEKWDGSGYPEGLKGEQIPLAARLMAIADV
ncbi:MAG: HD domain-containing protein, partial [Nitrospinota bacterium]|nr:HD domain-containing protein [Nitrospinota bacterium]